MAGAVCASLPGVPRSSNHTFRKVDDLFGADIDSVEDVLEVAKRILSGFDLDRRTSQSGGDCVEPIPLHGGKECPAGLEKNEIAASFLAFSDEPH